MVTIKDRIWKTLPPWFGDSPAAVLAVLDGVAEVLGAVYDLITYVTGQCRIDTVSGGFLDMVAGDFLGDSLPRKINESDDLYRVRVKIDLFRDKGTREAVLRAISELTGNPPIIFEPRYVPDTGAYRKLGGYGVYGGYGSMRMPYQAAITVFRPLNGMRVSAGYGINQGGYSVPSNIKYVGGGEVGAAALDKDIFEIINRVKPIATVLWVNVQDIPEYVDGGGAWMSINQDYDAGEW